MPRQQDLWSHGERRLNQQPNPKGYQEWGGRGGGGGGGVDCNVGIRCNEGWARSTGKSGRKRVECRGG